MKNKRYQKGQALAEMTVGMVGIMVVFVALLFISALGIVNIKTLLTARGEADEHSYMGIISDQGRSIHEWSYGNDDLLFTADDRAQVGTMDVADFFRSQLVSTDGQLDAGSFDENYVKHNFAQSFPTQTVFLSAADMASHTEVEPDPLGERNLSADLQTMFEYLVFNGQAFDFTLRESVYMPKVNE